MKKESFEIGETSGNEAENPRYVRLIVLVLDSTVLLLQPHARISYPFGTGKRKSCAS
jgi:TRAP-type mannitol/chloroaromatic compound transport system permease small subunit